MASITKPFVGTATMQLVERGSIDLDAPVVKYLPYFKLADDRYGQTVRSNFQKSQLEFSSFSSRSGHYEFVTTRGDSRIQRTGLTSVLQSPPLGSHTYDGGSQGMNNHLIVCVLALVGCLAVPLGGQGLSTGDSQYLNETEAAAPDECQIFERAVLTTVRMYQGALLARASGPATVLSILDDNDVLNPIRTYLRALTALRDCRRALPIAFPIPASAR